MQYLRFLGVCSTALLSLTYISLSARAEGNQLAPIDNTPPEYEQTTKQIEQQNNRELNTVLPSETPEDTMTKEESIQYLLKNPEEFEFILGNALRQGNADVLEELLPYYKQVTNYDPSVIDWGNAIIDANHGRLDKAVSAFRDINAKLPDVNILRFQMALALFYNRQFEAAKSEFEKLRSVTKQEEDIQVINNYLEAINEQNSWDFSASVSYINDNNLNNVPEKDVKYDLGNGQVVTYSSPRETGQGVDFSFYGDKKWNFDNKTFTALHLSSYGNYYWDNKNYNIVTTGIGTGVGYQNAATEIELSPFYNKRWYGQGKSGDGKLHDYSDTLGAKLSVSQWMSPKWRYQGVLQHSKTNYIKKYSENDGKDLFFANTLLYSPSAKQYWAVGVDYAHKKAKFDEKNYDREGLRLIYGQTWPKGYSTRLRLSAAKRHGQDYAFVSLPYTDKEYSAGISLWNRGFSILGLTPRLNYSYDLVDSNISFREYDKHNVSVEFTKAF